jgi:hypothetical protein
MIDALIKRVSVTYKCYEMYAHRVKKDLVMNAKKNCSSEIPENTENEIKLK